MSDLATTQRTLLVLLPEFIILATAIIMMTAGAFTRLPRRAWAAASAVALAAALMVLGMLWYYRTDPYGSVVLNDVFAGFTRGAFLVTGLILLAMAHDQVDDGRAAEFFGSLLMIVAGSMLIAGANEMVLLFVGLELVSIPTYLLLYLPRRNLLTQEAATKYFYLSIFSSGLLLFGLAYLYGLTGVSNLKGLTYLFQTVSGPENVETGLGVLPLGFGLIALVFITAGLGFRVAAVPFHFYAPDVYQGSPTVIAALLAWIPKGIGFVAILRVLTNVIGGANPLAERAVLLAWVIAVITMTLGNTVALLQDDLKRLLAYSSIAHAGYLMIGVAVAFRDGPGSVADPSAIGPYLGAQGVLFYLAAYALMTLGAFAVIIALSTPERPVELVDDLAGLARTRPGWALAMALCLFSLAGIPPLAGFWGKFQIFAAAVSVGDEHYGRMFQVLALIGVLNSAVGAYYYLRIVIVMYLRAPVGEPIAPRPGWPTTLAVAACAGLSLLFGVLPEPINRASRRAAVAALEQPRPPIPETVAAVDRAD